MAPCLIVLLAIALGLSYVGYRYHQSAKYEHLKQRHSKWAACIYGLSSYLDNDEFWMYIGDISNDCEYNLKIDNDRLKSFNGEKRLHLMLSEDQMKEDSLILTMGVRHGDVTAEGKLKNLLTKNSLFIIFDPDTTNWQHYRKQIENGQFLPKTVGNKNGLITTHTKINGSMVTKKVSMITLPELLKRYISQKIVDNMWIDIEYREYDIFDFFRTNSPIFEKEDLALCQFNIMVHIPKNEGQKSQFHEFMTGVLADKRFVFLKVMPFDGNWRIFFLDFADKGCMNRYLLPE